jgi:predicted PurR-regulated permease PerM
LQNAITALWSIDQGRRIIAVRGYALTGILFLAFIVVLKLARPLLTPIALAAFFFLLLVPLVTFLVRLRLPRSFAAALVIALLFGCLGLAALRFAEPAAKWIEEIPRVVPSIKAKLLPVSEPISKIEAAASEVENLTQLASAPPPATVQLENDGYFGSLMEAAPLLVISLMVVIFLTFFLLVYGERLRQNIAQLGRSFAEQRRLIRIGRDIQNDISTFLSVITLINTALGALAALAFWLLGVPNFLLWGCAVAVANFVPYAGAAVMFVVLAAVGLISFDTLAEAALVPLSFLALTIIEGQLVTPILVGRRLDLNPLVIFVAVIFWTYIWGLVGALVAVPIIASTRIVLGHFPALRPLARLLGR